MFVDHHLLCWVATCDAVFALTCLGLYTLSHSMPDFRQWGSTRLASGWLLIFKMCAPITSGLVGIFSPNFSRPRDELSSTNEKVISRILIHPNCSYTVSWRKSICHVVLFGVIHQLPLLRGEFRLPKLTFHSDLRQCGAGTPHVGLCHALLVHDVFASSRLSSLFFFFSLSSLSYSLPFIRLEGVGSAVSCPTRANRSGGCQVAQRIWVDFGDKLPPVVDIFWYEFCYMIGV